MYYRTTSSISIFMILIGSFCILAALNAYVLDIFLTCLGFMLRFFLALIGFFLVSAGLNPRRTITQRIFFMRGWNQWF